MLSGDEGYVLAEPFNDYLEGEHPIFEFLEDFPGTTEMQAVAVREHAGELLEADAPAA